MQPVRELARLLLPVACPCGELDVLWCARCAALLAGPPGPRRARRTPAGPAGRRPAGSRVGAHAVHRADPGRGGALEGPRAGRPRPAARARVAARRRPRRPAARNRARYRARYRVQRCADRRRPRALHRCRTQGTQPRTRRGPGTRGHARPARRRGLRAPRPGPRPRRRGAGPGGSRRPRTRAQPRGCRPHDETRGAGARKKSVCILVDDVLTTGATLAAVERALERPGTTCWGQRCWQRRRLPAREARPARR